MIQLKNRTTYRDARGNPVHIAGPARRGKVDGEEVFWSIEGDHYTASGRFVLTDRKTFAAYTQESSIRNIASEDTSPEAAAWWNLVELREETPHRG